MNTITIELSKEDRQRLDVISDTLELIRLALTNAGTPFPAAPAAPAAPQEAPAAPQEAPAPAAKEEPAPEPEKPTAAAPSVSLADVQKKVVGLSTKGKKDAVKAIVQAYAPKVSAIPEDKLEEVMARLVELEG